MASGLELRSTTAVQKFEVPVRQVPASSGLDPQVRAMRRRSYGRICIQCIMAKSQSVCAFPNMLLWYSRLRECRSQKAFPVKVFPLWVMTQALLEMGVKVGGSIRRRSQHDSVIRIESDVANTEE